MDSVCAARYALPALIASMQPNMVSLWASTVYALSTPVVGRRPAPTSRNLDRLHHHRCRLVATSASRSNIHQLQMPRTHARQVLGHPCGLGRGDFAVREPLHDLANCHGNRMPRSRNRWRIFGEGGEPSAYPHPRRGWYPTSPTARLAAGPLYADEPRYVTDR